MKKMFTKYAALLFVLILINAIPAAASDNSEDLTSLANCSHSSYTSSYYYSYIGMNADYHEVYRTERRKCNYCNDIFYTGNPVAQALESHSGSWSYERSDHTGADVSAHYYIYSMTCSVCHGKYEQTRPAACRAGYCIDPYSLNNIILQIN